VEKVKAAAVSAEVDWLSYFESIQQECPWSLKAWKQGKICIAKWKGTALPLDAYSARMYLMELNPRRLKKLCKKLDIEDKDCEWLWSHPSYGNNSTPVPVLIQQNRKQLNDIRSSMGSSN
jgi:hypothetical protein